ncbi:MAG: aspartate/glutamate racemase family protein [Paenibacillus macerans]|uniref:Hydantoin racemase n=1 Tax=Paenibacillus macerans TaxID=44252 RepID=A0A091A3U3_PAEMA|nr:aspartate/glutamate racemase family protein [Paenibacillus macerans]KFN10961.1 asp/Glu/Hydantoin racemase family protein [Paenibacillus macerans]MBS5910921.1 aspartate/glutamate racemase family protein [Paenibacillus macerans]MCY7562103.1 aspartate/glutamate racemase family protein [Paenibacillus macerans]MDU5950110.1 aspartate/glutamate racemase family protein [Paenibacillus macerans]MDU7476805.1 aspartate/glutamate racemase family protein [Paenibacillus macerans]
MLGIIRVITLQDRRDAELHGELIRQKFGLDVRSACIPDQPSGVYDERTERLAVPKIVALAKRLADEGCTAIGISCAADPALEECRQALSVPVLGAGSCAAHLSLTQSTRVGVLTILQETPPLIRSILGEAYVGMDRPEGVTTTLDLRTDRGREAAFEAAQRLARRGAAGIVLACTGFATIGFAAELKAQLGLTAFDPIDSLGAAAVMAERHNNGSSSFQH